MTPRHMYKPWSVDADYHGPKHLHDPDAPPTSIVSVRTACLLHVRYVGNIGARANVATHEEGEVTCVECLKAIAFYRGEREAERVRRGIDTKRSPA